MAYRILRIGKTQVEPFKSKNEAMKLAKKIRRAGYKTEIMKSRGIYFVAKRK